jgi:hypothetical protein
VGEDLKLLLTRKNFLPVHGLDKAAAGNCLVTLHE